MSAIVSRLLLPLVVLGCFSVPALAKIDLTVSILGVSPQQETNVRLFLSIEQQKEHALLDKSQLTRLHKTAAKEIEQALQPYGLYRTTLEQELKQDDDGRWQAIYRINPGPVLPLGIFDFKIDAEMSADAEFQLLLREESPKVGGDFVHSDYESFKTSLARLANERGYFDAQFITHRVEVDLDAYQARIYLDYRGGTRYRFGELILSQDILNSGLMRRFVTFRTGEPYYFEQLLEFQQALTNSDYFQNIEISPIPTTDNSAIVPIHVSLTTRKPNRYNLGLGYGTDTGARAKFGWHKPRVNKRGHKFDTDLSLSEIGYSFLTTYRVPIFNPRTDQISYSISEIQEKFDNGISTKRTVGVKLSQGRGKWREAVSLEYQSEDFTEADEPASSNLLIPGINWSRIWGNDFINVLDGLRFDIDFRGASDQFVSDTTFTQLRSSIKFITSLGPRDRIITRGTAGAISTREFDQIPSSIRFFSGGGNSVRGYPYQSLAPVDSDGDVIGGRYLLQGSIEYEHYFDDKWGAALFFDRGKAIDDLSEDLESGAGFGMRWKSPVGPIRVDLANSISADNPSWRLHLNIGPDL
ncbi:MAG: translocation and assembly module TamA [Planctomycetota bacterium]|jgi:translocation and assembly module TamA